MIYESALAHTFKQVKDIKNKAIIDLRKEAFWRLNLRHEDGFYKHWTGLNQIKNASPELFFTEYFATTEFSNLDSGLKTLILKPYSEASFLGGDYVKLITLSINIAKKVRELIRPANQTYFTDNIHFGSQYKDVHHLKALFFAQRSTKPNLNDRKDVYRAYKEENPLSLKNDEKLKEISKKFSEDFLKNLKNSSRRSKEQHFNGKEVTEQEKIEADAKNAIRFRVGACSEMASLATVILQDPELRKEEYSAQVFYLAITSPNGTNHATILILPQICQFDFNVLTKQTIYANDEYLREIFEKSIICDPWFLYMNKPIENTDVLYYKQTRSDVYDYIFNQDERVLAKTELTFRRSYKIGDGYSERFNKKHLAGGNFPFYKSTSEDIYRKFSTNKFD